MTTPNIELIKQLRALGIPDWKTARWLMTEAADALQSQAERIKEFEGACVPLSEYADLALDNDTLRAQIAEIEKVEPVAARVWVGSYEGADNENQYVYSEDGDGEPLFTRPMPADVTELVEALEEYGRAGVGNSTDWRIQLSALRLATKALAKYKGAKL